VRRNNRFSAEETDSIETNGGIVGNFI